MTLNKKIKILVVEDETEAREYVRDVLVPNGYEVEEALDSEEAFERFNAFKPDVVIMDIKLDGSQYNGIQIAERLLKQSSFILMYYTANAVNYRKEVNNIPNGWIFKGTTSDEILIQVNDCIKKHLSILRGYENDKYTFKVNHGDDKNYLIDLSKLVFIKSENVGNRTTRTRFYVLDEFEKDYFKVLNPKDVLQDIEQLGYTHMVRVHNGFAVNRVFVDDFDFMQDLICYVIKNKEGKRIGHKSIKTSDNYKENIENLKKYRACKY